MRTLLRAAGLLAVVAFLAAGQNGYVENAVGNGLLNVISPQMLARVSEQGVFYLFPPEAIKPAAARVYIRPAGSSVSAAATVVSATSGLNASATFVVPAGIPYGAAEIYWQIDGGAFHFVGVTVGRSNLALRAGVRLLQADGSTSEMTVSTPARQGQTLVARGSGLGYGQAVTASIAGMAARVIYAGHGPGAGDDTFQIEAPAGVAGCYLPLTVTVGETSASATVHVSSGGEPCNSELPLTSGDLRAIEGIGRVSTQIVNLSTTLSVADAAVASRQASMSVRQGSIGRAELTSWASERKFGCSVHSTGTAIERTGDFVAVLISREEAGGPPGPFVTLSNGRSIYKLLPSPNGYDMAPLPAQEKAFASLGTGEVTGGSWVVSWPGSSVLAPSTFSFALPEPLQLTEEAVARVERGRDRTFAWAGSFDPAAAVGLSLTGTTGGGESARQVDCLVRASDGHTVIPQALLADFDAGSLAAVRATLSISGMKTPAKRLVLADGVPLVLLVNYSATDTRPVEIQ